MSADSGVPEPVGKLAELLAEGMATARQIGNPVVAGRHLEAWLLRLACSDPRAALASTSHLRRRPGLLEPGPPEEEDDPEPRVRRFAVLECVGREGDGALDLVAAELRAARDNHPADRLDLINQVSEAATRSHERRSAGARAILELLSQEARTLAGADEQGDCHGTLALALVGEARLASGDPDGAAMIEEALSRPAPDHVRRSLLQFVASVDVPGWATRLWEAAGELSDPEDRLDVWVSLLQGTRQAELPPHAPAAAHAAALALEPARGIEPLLRLARALAGARPAAARDALPHLVEAADAAAGELRALQQAAVAAVVARVDPDWGRRLFSAARESALHEQDAVRRVASLVVLANEMASSCPREAAAVFQEGMEAAAGLSAVWEYAHILELVFHTDRSPYLDIVAVIPVIESVLRKLETEDSLFPGMFGRGDACRVLAHVDAARARPHLERWFELAEQSADTAAMAHAALLIRYTDPVAGDALLRRVPHALQRRVDCMAAGEFARIAARAAPRVVLPLLDGIADRRERGEATGLVAVGLYECDPAAGLALIREMGLPEERSTALLLIADTLLGRADLPTPQPLFDPQF